MRYSFTGIVELEDKHHPIIRSTLENLSDGQEFNTGGAKGVDIYVEQMLDTLYPQSIRRVILPAAPYSPLAGKISFTTEVIDLSDGGFKYPLANSYRERNEYMVNLCDVLIAFPKTEKELFKGSGTWMTIRIARKAGKEVRIFPLEQ